MATHALPGRGQGKPIQDTIAIVLSEHINQLRVTTQPCIANLTFSGHDAALGEYTLFFRITPCYENGDTTTVGSEPCLLGEIAYRSAAPEIATICFDTVYQEGGHAGPAEYFPFNKGGKNYFVVLYKWPVKHYDVEGAFYQARIYRIEAGARVRFWKSDWLFEEEFDGFAEGRTTRAKFKTRRAIERKLRAANLENAPRQKH